MAAGMKRYWVSIAIIIFMIVGVSAYYMANNLDRLPTYKLVAMQGNPELGSSISLSGVYTGRTSHKAVNISLQGSYYRQDLSFYDWLKNTITMKHYDTKFIGLLKDYRNFMRGKRNNNDFYQDKDWLIYASIERTESDSDHLNMKITIEKLNLNSNKVTNQVTLMEHDPKRGVWPFVAAVKRAGDELHLIITDGTEYKDYVTTISDGQYLRTVSISPEITPRDGAQLAMNMINQVTRSANDYALFIVWDQLRTERDYSEIAHLMTYHYSTGRMNKLIGLHTEDMLSKQYDLHDSQLVMLEYNEEKINLQTYKIQADVIEQTDSIQLTAQDLGAQRVNRALLYQNKVYISLVNGTVPQLAIVDPADGSVLYRAQVTRDDTEAMDGELLQQLQVHDIGIHNNYYF